MVAESPLLNAEVFTSTVFTKELLEAIWQGGFFDYDVEPETCDLLNDNLFYVESLRDVRDELILQSKTFTSEQWNGLWKVVAATEETGRRILTILACLVESPKYAESSAHAKDASILAATTYLTLAKISGCSTFQFFHPVIFQKCIDVLKNFHSFSGMDKRKRGRSKGSVGSTASQKSQTQKRISQESQPFFEEVNEDLELSDHDIIRLQQLLTVLLQSLIAYLKHDSLKKHPHLSEAVICLLSGLTRVESTSFSAGFDKEQQPWKVKSLCQLAYMGIGMLCKRSEGLSVAMVKQAFSSLQQNLLMLVGPRKETLTTIPRETTMVKDQAVAFVLHIMQLGGDNIRSPLHRLVRSSILSTPDRSEYRVKVSQVILRIMERMSSLLYSETCKWIFELSKYKKLSGRMLAVEIIGSLLTSSDFRIIEESPAIDEELIHYTSRAVLLQALLMRCSDKAASVMAKALSMVALCLNCNDGLASKEIRDFITPCPSRIQKSRVRKDSETTTPGANEISTASCITQGETNPVDTACSSRGKASNLTRYEFTRSTNPTCSVTFYLTRGFDITLTDSEGLVSLIKRRLQLPKANVRKAALLALENAIIYNEGIGMSEELQVLREHCRDVAVPNRKQAIQSLTRMLQLYPTNSAAQRAWLGGVLPTHDDSEASVQEKCCDVVKSVIFNPINDGEDAALAWQLCSIMMDSMPSLPQMLKSVCVQLNRRGDLPADFVKILTSYISSEHGKEAWLMLSVVCPIISAKNKQVADLLASHWLEGYNSLSESAVRYTLSTLSILAEEIGPSKRQSLIADLLSRLKTFSMPIKYIKHTAVALSQLVKSDKVESGWVQEIVEPINQFLSELIYADSYDSRAAECVPIYLITLGEVCVHDPKSLSQSLIQIVQSLLILPKVSGEEKRLGFLADMSSGLLPSSIRHAALLCLGQICIQHEAVAKRNIPMLANELETSKDAFFSRVIVIILCDLCRLYTNAVGPYISSVSSSLQHNDAEVRQSTFISMVRLLQEDFLKWSGDLFYRFISCIVDESPAIAELAKQTFIHELSKRNKAMYLQHFVECLFFFNNYTSHRTYNKFPQMAAERVLFSLPGKDNMCKRQQIYNFMLDHMTDMHKFTVTQRLCQDILTAAVEKELALDTPEGAALLVDALSILQGKNIKLSVTKAPSAGSLIDEELTPSQASSSKATAAVVSKMVRKNFVETVIPDIVSLKVMLEASHSPTVKHLMLFLIEITKDYKAELADTLAGNEQLAAELAFDIKKFEERACLDETEVTEDSTISQVSVRNTSVMRTPVVRTPGTRTPIAMTPVARTPAVRAQANLSKTSLNTSVVTPTNVAQKGTPMPRPISGTPAMPPPPLRSVLKKPKMTGKQLMNSPENAGQTVSSSRSSGSSGRLTKRVNFDDEDDENQPEFISTRDSASSMLRAPLQPVISNAVGARAISTPDGNMADLTFAGNTSRLLTPILVINRCEDEMEKDLWSRLDERKGDSQRKLDQRKGNSQRKLDQQKSDSRSSLDDIPDDPLTRLWNLKSPLKKMKNHKPRAPVSVDRQYESEIISDPLTSLPALSRSKSLARKAGRKYKK